MCKKRILSLITLLFILLNISYVNIFASGEEIAYITVENTTYSVQAGAPWEGKLIEMVPIVIESGETMADFIKKALQQQNM